MTNSKRIYISSFLMSFFLFSSALPTLPSVEDLLGLLPGRRTAGRDPFALILDGLVEAPPQESAGDEQPPVPAGGGEEEGIAATLRVKRSLMSVWNSHSGKILFVSGAISGAILISLLRGGGSGPSVAAPNSMGAIDIEHLEAALRLMKASGSGRASSKVAGLLGLG